MGAAARLELAFHESGHEPGGVKIGGQPDSVVGSALQLPFADGSFDLVVASQMTHHLTNEKSSRTGARHGG